MKRRVLISVIAAFGFGCGDKDEAGRSPGAAASKPVAPVRAASPEPEAPKRVVYSAQAADKLIGELSTCTSRGFCDAYEPLRGFGPKISKQLVALVADAKTKSSHKRMALTLLKDIKDPAAAMPLFAVAKAEKSFINRYDLYEAAAASGGEEIFSAMTSFYNSKAGQEHQLQMRRGLRLFGSKLVGWAAKQMKTSKDQVALADLVSDVANESDKSTVLSLLASCKNQMACHRLAATAIRLGEVGQFKVLLAGLRAKNVYDRSDAANFFAKVAKSLPADQKDEAIKLLAAGKAKDRGGLTAMGYSRSLKALGAN